MSKIGILGGTFDPIHNGHIALAQAARQQFGLNVVWMMTSPDPPHKLEQKKTSYAKRSRMTKLGVKGVDGLEYSGYEAQLPQPSYTAQTLAYLKKDYPEDTFYFIIGEDSLDHIESWYEPERIMALTTLIVASRTEDFESRSIEEQISYLSGKYHARILQIQWDGVEISSTEIRNMVASGQDISKLVPEAVRKYIWKEKLYQN